MRRKDLTFKLKKGDNRGTLFRGNTKIGEFGFNDRNTTQYKYELEFPAIDKRQGQMGVHTVCFRTLESLKKYALHDRKPNDPYHGGLGAFESVSGERFEFLHCFSDAHPRIKEAADGEYVVFDDGAGYGIIKKQPAAQPAYKEEPAPQQTEAAQSSPRPAAAGAMQWSPQQEKALREVSQWIKHETDFKQIFRLFGFAGTGKTTLAKTLAQDLKGAVCFGAFTGKAALVLRQKGCAGASTIHSMIYKPRELPGGRVEFILNRDSEIRDAKLVIIDECSMVDAGLGRDLEWFGKPILVLGDPAQLPPISGAGYFTEGVEPDIMLEEVHRQAADNPIIRMSMDVREGRKLEKGSYGDSRVISLDELDSDTVLAADQLLVGRNATRTEFNRSIRQAKGYNGDFPNLGEKLICLRNNRLKGLLNGGIWYVRNLGKNTERKVVFDASPEHDMEQVIEMEVRKEFFWGTADKLEPNARRSSDEFDFGACTTVHKAQGSQWNSVTLIDESRVFREHRHKWLYTGITRAAEKITVAV